jgi:hypothetical protein
MTEKQIERIRKKIKILRGRLSAEKKKFGGYFDNGGLRYIIPELYLQIHDYKGALVYFRWFSKSFTDDIGMPSFNLLWTITLYKNKKIDDAIRKAYETAITNTYLLELICGKNPVQLDKSELWGAEGLDYAKQILEGCLNLLTPEFMKWICELTETEEFSKNINLFISLQKLISDDSMKDQREKLLAESFKLERRLKGG